MLGDFPLPWVGKLKTFRQFDNRHLRYVACASIAESFREKENVFKDSSSHSFLSSVSHKLSFPKKRRSTGSPRSAFALEGSVAFTRYLRNRYATSLSEKCA
jgi:hypothetical protein